MTSCKEDLIYNQNSRKVGYPDIFVLFLYQYICCDYLPYLPNIFGQTGLGNSVNPDETHKCSISSGSTWFATHSAILDTTLCSKLYLFKFKKKKYGKELRCWNTLGKYGNSLKFQELHTSSIKHYESICLMFIIRVKTVFFFFFFLICVLRPFQEYFTYIEPIVHRR